jgi:hypothetical protein
MQTMTPPERRLSHRTARLGAVWRDALMLVLWAAAAASAQAAPASAEAAEPYSAASSPYSHRPLRSNQPPAVLAPTDPASFAGYAAAPPFSVMPRQQLLQLYPCSQCHKVLPLNTQPRKLVNAPHAAALQHGNGRIWCLDCHLGNDRDFLHTVGGAKVEFNQSYLVCGQCHSARQRDWYFGAHGKRVANWTGEREIYSCTHCHDPHNPTTATRLPSKAPPIRAGLTPMAFAHDEALLPWQKNPKGGSDGTATSAQQH